MGLKAIAIYRDGSKRTQPLNTSRSDFDGSDKGAEVKSNDDSKPTLRARMPATRSSITHKFAIAGHEGYMTVGLYEDGRPGELFITMAKEGSTVGGIMNAFGTAISLCLQYGVPLRALVGKFSHSRFEPSGYTDNPDIPIAKSLVDYIFRWLEFTFPTGSIPELAMPAKRATASLPEQKEIGEMSDSAKLLSQIQNQEDSPVCDQCGHITTRNGACYRCHNCGNSMGCS
jgi:ribonucleoside-diphosphate reductase alpha chain